MTKTTKTRVAHPADHELADLLAGVATEKNAKAVREHLAVCGRCLERSVAAYDTIKRHGRRGHKEEKEPSMKNFNYYLAGAIISFSLSFIIPSYFIQLLVATLILGMKWVVDSKTTRTLIMIQEAWRRGGEKETSRVLQELDPKKRF